MKETSGVSAFQLAPVDPGFYKSAAWRKIAALVKREERRCRFCGKSDGRLVVDHIKPRRVRPDLALVRSNLQLLCSTCHDREKAQVERRLYGMRQANAPKPQSVTADGRHTDPQHPWSTRKGA